MGSEMCIRDSYHTALRAAAFRDEGRRPQGHNHARDLRICIPLYGMLGAAGVLVNPVPATGAVAAWDVVGAPVANSRISSAATGPSRPAFGGIRCGLTGRRYPRVVRAIGRRFHLQIEDACQVRQLPRQDRSRSPGQMP